MWNLIKSNISTFQFGQEPELIHIIKTGHKNQYIIVYEDAYEYMNGKCELLSSEGIKKKFDIDISDVELRQKYSANVEGSEEFNKSNKISHESLRMESIELLTKIIPNDQDLGKEVRKFVNIKKEIV